MRYRRTRSDEEREDEAALLKVLADPLRIKILAITSERVTSPNRIAVELNEPVNRVAYHARTLRNYGLIELVEERPVRGATEHFYRAVSRPWFDESCWAKLDPEVRRAISDYTLEKIMDDATRALRSGTFEGRDSRHLSRVPMLLDQEGFANVGRVLDDTLDAILAEQAASDERRGTSRERGIPTTVAMASFEVPPRESVDP